MRKRLAQGLPFLTARIGHRIGGQQASEVLPRPRDVRVADYGDSNAWLFGGARTGDENIHESLRALLPVRTGGHAGDADECPK